MLSNPNLLNNTGSNYPEVVPYIHAIRQLASQGISFFEAFVQGIRELQEEDLTPGERLLRINVLEQPSFENIESLLAALSQEMRQELVSIMLGDNRIQQAINLTRNQYTSKGWQLDNRDITSISNFIGLELSLEGVFGEELANQAITTQTAILGYLDAKIGGEFEQDKELEEKIAELDELELFNKELITLVETVTGRKGVQQDDPLLDEVREAIIFQLRKHPSHPKNKQLVVVEQKNEQKNHNEVSLSKFSQGFFNHESKNKEEIKEEIEEINLLDNDKNFN